MPLVRRLCLVLGLLALALFGTAHGARAATQLPCDIYASAGTPCVAAHSTTRALYANFNGRLYQVYRSSDGTTQDIGVLSAGGYANAAAQDSFCANTYCIISRIYDQSGKGNDLAIAPAGDQGPADHGAPAEALAVTAGGHAVYGIEFSGHMGYRNDSTTGVAVEGKPESMYMVTSGIHANAGCCFDYGNAEIHNNDPGDGHMDAVNFGTECYYSGKGPCYGNGPWVMSDLENGLFESNLGYSTNSSYTGNTQTFVTAMLKNNGQNHFAMKSADATAGGLFTIFDGATPANNINRPSQGSSDFGYTPMHQEGAIILGIGGDNSQSGIGSFFEGVMTAGYPSNDADNAVQANIAAVGYSTSPVGGSPGTLKPGSAVSLRATTACCTGDYIRHQNGNIVISALSSSSSLLDRSDATWIVRRGLANNACVSFESKNYPGEFIRHYNSILYRQPYVGIELDANAASDATFCPVAGKNGQGSSFQSVNYSSKYIRHYQSTGYIASNGGSNAWDNAASWSDDVSWIVTAPLAN
ncbi:MAG: AbfB domain-containing protein [Gluconacetobacter diazotrophicus]|nr:AbfB domain-containing protein [Gluconacetobacter diazotrophicus]